MKLQIFQALLAQALMVQAGSKAYSTYFILLVPQDLLPKLQIFYVSQAVLRHVLVLSQMCGKPRNSKCTANWRSAVQKSVQMNGPCIPNT